MAINFEVNYDTNTEILRIAVSGYQTPEDVMTKKESLKASIIKEVAKTNGKPFKLLVDMTRLEIMDDTGAQFMSELQQLLGVLPIAKWATVFSGPFLKLQVKRLARDSGVDKISEDKRRLFDDGRLAYNWLLS